MTPSISIERTLHQLSLGRVLHGLAHSLRNPQTRHKVALTPRPSTPRRAVVIFAKDTLKCRIGGRPGAFCSRCPEPCLDAQLLRHGVTTVRDPHYKVMRCILPGKVRRVIHKWQATAIGGMPTLLVGRQLRLLSLCELVTQQKRLAVCNFLGPGVFGPVPDAPSSPSLQLLQCSRASPAAYARPSSGKGSRRQSCWRR